MQTSRMSPGDQVYAREGGTMFGAVRRIDEQGGELVIYIEGTGDQRVPIEAVVSAHDGKVLLKMAALSDAVKQAVMRAHDQELPGL